MAWRTVNGPAAPAVDRRNGLRDRRGARSASVLKCRRNKLKVLNVNRL